MSLNKPYLDVPGTTVFDAEQSRLGYHLNQFCMSLMKAENRARWVERGKAPANLQVVEQEVKAPFATTRALPLCEWPQWPHYKGGSPSQANSFECSK